MSWKEYFSWNVPQGKFYWPFFLANSLSIHASVLSFSLSRLELPRETVPDVLPLEYVAVPGDGRHDDSGNDTLTGVPFTDKILPLPLNGLEDHIFALLQPQETFLDPARDGESLPVELMPQEHGAFSPPVQVDILRLAENARKAPDYCSLYTRNDDPPEVLTILIDSSGSMSDDFYTAPATTCAYRAALSALERGSYVRVLNFSTRTYMVDSTTDRQHLAQGICLQQKGDTFLPANIKDAIREERSDVLIVSDSMIRRYEEALVQLEEVLLRAKRNKSYFAVIGDERSQWFINPKVLDDFQQAGFRILP